MFIEIRILFQKANRENRFRNQKNVIFSIPMAAIQAAEPMIKMLPPLPAAYARNSQK